VSRVAAGEQAGGEADPDKAERYEECEEYQGIHKTREDEAELRLERGDKVRSNNTFL